MITNSSTLKATRGLPLTSGPCGISRDARKMAWTSTVIKIYIYIYICKHDGEIKVLKGH